MTDKPENIVPVTSALNSGASQPAGGEKAAKKPGFLRRIFQNASNRINNAIPKTPRQALLTALSGARAYLILPFTLKGVFLAVAFSQIVPPMTAGLFPTAQDFLKGEGLDPQIAEKLAPGKTVRVRERGLLGTPHAFFDMPFFMGANQAQLLYDEAAYAIKSPLYEQCRVVMPGRNITARSVISLFTGIPEDKIENVPMSDKEAYYTIAFHEFRHCADENAEEGSINLIEGNADIKGAEVAAKTFSNPEIARTFMYMRALSFEPTHDGTLYIDSTINGTDPIFKELGAAANEEAMVYMEKYYPGKLQKLTPLPLLGGGGYINFHVLKAYEAFGIALEKHGDQMSQNAKRRAELFREGVEYFAPAAVGKAPMPQPAPKTPAPGPALAS